MNLLSLTTNPTNDPHIFDTCWMTGLLQKGRVRVHVPRLDDARTAAELSAMQYLLVEKNVCGHNKAGAGLVVNVSCSSIIDLVAGESAKSYLAPYANFLRTRFLGAAIEWKEAPFAWADELCEQQVDSIEVGKPSLTVIEVANIGRVELTAHAVDKYVRRFDRKPEKAWRELKRIGRDGKLAKLIGRNAIHDIKHRRPGRYVLDEKRDVLLVIADPDDLNSLPRLVTVVKPEHNAQLIDAGAAA